MTEPASSAAPVTSVVRVSSRRRWGLRLRRLVVDASWLPFVVLVFFALMFDGPRGSFPTFVVSLSLSLVWPVVVIHNVVRGRPPRWGSLIHAGVGLLNVLVAAGSAIMILMLFFQHEGLAAGVLVVGGIGSFVLFIAVLAHKRQRFPFVAAVVSAVAALFLTLVAMSMTEARMWRRWRPSIAEAPPFVDYASTVMVAPPAPTPAPVVVAPPAPVVPVVPVVEPPPAPSEPAVVSPFEHGAESDCAVEVVDKARRVWLVGGREPPCDWLVTLDDTQVCGDEDDAGIVHVEGHPEVRLSLVRHGKRVDSKADFMDHSRQGASLRINGAKATPVTVHSFCIGQDDDDEPYDGTMPNLPPGYRP